MLRRSTLTAAAFVLLLTLTACNGVTREWPIPGLTLPSGTTPAPFPSSMISQGIGDFSETGNLYPNEQSSSWGKCFNYSGNWDTLSRDIDSKLRSNGYRDYEGPELGPIRGLPESYDKKQLVRAYLRKDGKYKVLLLNFGYLRSRSGQTMDGGDYVLVIDLAKLN